MWDGFLRLNTETKKGGIVGVCRHGATETKRTGTVPYLAPSKKYRVTAMNGNVVASLTGKALQTSGFPVTLTEPYAGVLFEICAQ